jgi:hypothetical protein
MALGAEEPLYETTTFSVCRVPHIFELHYGVHFKDTDEFGLYTILVDKECYDEPGKKPFIDFVRSNANFDEKTYLDDIGIDEPV